MLFLNLGLAQKPIGTTYSLHYIKFLIIQAFNTYNRSLQQESSNTLD